MLSIIHGSAGLARINGILEWNNGVFWGVSAFGLGLGTLVVLWYYTQDAECCMETTLDEQ